MAHSLLVMENITKSFPGVKALDGVSLRVDCGTTHALMGENGAGKSTLMKCLFGFYEKDEGRVFLDGEEVFFKSPKEALEGGVAMVHQELNQAEKLTVAENLWLGRFPRYTNLLPIVNRKKMLEDTKEIFDSLGIKIDPTAKVNTLPISKRQMIEIAKAVSYGARVIVFDEPTSSLSDEEANRLFGIIDSLKAKGCAIIYISHKMEEILKISDFVTVMRDGRHIATKPASELTTGGIIKLMVGRELSNRYPKKQNTPGEELLRVEGLSSEYANLTDVSFSLKKGEILGVAGLDGAGRTELLENLFGIAKRRSGEIYLEGRRVSNSSPRDSIKNGFALVTEDRRATGIFGILSIRENTVVSSLKKYKRGIFLSAKKIGDVTRKYIDKIKVKTPDDMTKIRSLSGGNQQKVIFSRWLLTEPAVLLLDEPTRGIDVMAKYEIYKLIGELAAKGRGIIVVSSEMPELIGICDRILVMSGGRLAGEVSPDCSQEEIMRLATKNV